jgi:hypothetical protein
MVVKIGLVCCCCEQDLELQLKKLGVSVSLCLEILPHIKYLFDYGFLLFSSLFVDIFTRAGHHITCLLNSSLTSYYCYFNISIHSYIYHHLVIPVFIVLFF